MPAATALLAAGGAVAYLLDPQQGRGRRTRLRDQALAVARRERREALSSLRYAEGRLEGAVAAIEGAGEFEPADDRAIAEKLEEVIHAASFDTSKVTVEVADGVATLRGQLAEPGQIEELVQDCYKVNGVNQVANLLHLPGTEAPNKAASRRATRSAPEVPSVGRAGSDSGRR